TDESEDRVDPARGRAETEVVPEVAHADEGEEAGVEESEPASPAQEPAARRHYVTPCARFASADAPREPTPACASAMRAISRAPASTLWPKLNVHNSRSETVRSRKSPAPATSSARQRAAQPIRSDV